MADNYWMALRTRRVTRRTALRGAALGVAGLSGAALIGCGSNEKAADKPAATANTGGAPPAGATASAPTAAQPKKGGRIARAQAGDPITFDQHGQSTNLVNRPASPMFSTLVQFDPKDGDEKPTSIIPDLAQSWEVSKDGLTYTFKLKPGVKFHDGTPFVAGDVKASLDRQITPPKGLVPPRGDQLKVIKSMDTPDDLTLKLNMSRPASPLSMLPILGQGWMAIYAQKDIANDKFDWKNKANGTGPYRDLKYERGVKVTMERNKDYHVKDRPYLDGLDIYVILQAPSRDAAFQAGQLHIMEGLSSGTAAQVKAAAGDKAIWNQRSTLGFSVLNYNTSKAPWKDERVRRAVNLAINREDAIRIVAKGEAIFGGYLLPGGDWALPEAEIRKIPGYQTQGADSIAEAKKLLSAAGVTESLNVPILVRQNSYEDLCLFSADQLAKVGVKARLDIAESATFYDRMNKRDFDLVPFGHGVALDDPDAIWAEFYIKGAPRNYSELSTPEIEAAYLKQSVELDPVKRKALVADLQKVSLPALGKSIYYWSLSQSLYYKPVQGWVPHVSAANYNNQKFQDVWLNA